MPNPILPSELDEMMKNISSVPEPDVEFMDSLRTRFIMDGQASAIQNQEKTMKPRRISPRLAWALVIALLVAVALLAASPKVVTALKKLFGYIPNVGMVEQTTSVRVLAEPVAVEREGIRVTIVEVVADPSHTVVRFEVEWLAPPSTAGEHDASCQGMPGLSLVDGSPLNFVRTTDKTMIGEPGSNSGYGYTMEFAPVPLDQNDATFILPCLVPLATGPLPRDWRIPFHLIPAPQGTLLPVIKVNETETGNESGNKATPPPTQPAVDPGHGVRISLESFVPLDDGYLLTGSLQWDEQNFPAASLMDGSSIGVKPILESIQVVDVNGQEIPYEPVYGPETPPGEAYRSYWVIKVLGKKFQPPLTITMRSVEVQIHPFSFFINAGVTLLDGQVIDVNQDMQIAGSVVHVQTAHLQKDANDGTWTLIFDLQVDPLIVGDVTFVLVGNQCMGGGGGYPTEHLSQLQVYVRSCLPNLPADPLEIDATSAVLWGSWQVTWAP